MTTWYLNIYADRAADLAALGFTHFREHRHPGLPGVMPPSVSYEAKINFGPWAENEREARAGAAKYRQEARRLRLRGVEFHVEEEQDLSYSCAIDGPSDADPGL